MTSGNFSSAQPHVAQHLRAPLQRHGAGHRDGDVDVALVHRRQELGAEPRDQRRRAADHRHRDQRDEERAAHGHAQPAEVAVLQPGRNGGCCSLTGRRFSSAAVSAGTVVSVNSSAPAERERVGQRDGTEDAPLDALEREDRHHRRADDRHREQRRPDHLLGGLGHDVGDALGRRLLDRQVPVGVLDQDDRALQQDAEVDRPHRQQVRRHARVVEATNAVSSASGMTTDTASEPISARRNIQTTMLTSTIPSIMLCDTVLSVVSTRRVRS